MAPARAARRLDSDRPTTAPPRRRLLAIAAILALVATFALATLLSALPPGPSASVAPPPLEILPPTHQGNGTTPPVVLPLEVTDAATPTDGPHPLPVGFHSEVAGGVPPYRYAWELGLGETGLNASPLFVYEYRGVFEVNLTVTDALGHRASAVPLDVVVRATVGSMPLLVEPNASIGSQNSAPWSAPVPLPTLGGAPYPENISLEGSLVVTGCVGGCSDLVVSVSLGSSGETLWCPHPGGSTACELVSATTIAFGANAEAGTTIDLLVFNEVVGERQTASIDLTLYWTA